MDTKKETAGLYGIRKFIYEILYPFGLISTATLLLMSMFAEIANADSDYKPALTLRNVAVILVFCFFFALANRIFSKKNLSFGVRILLHCLVLTADFVVVGIFLSGYYSAGSPAVAVCAIFIAVYLIIAAIVSVIRYILIRTKIDHSKYKKQF